MNVNMNVKMNMDMKMNVKMKITWIRINCWIGAVADALVVIPMLSVPAGAGLLGIEKFNPGFEYRYAMGLGASLMLGWSFLLVWAQRKPLERRGVLMLTVFPVLTGLMAAGIYAVVTGYVAAEKMLPIWIFQVVMSISFAGSYFASRDIGRGS